MTAAERGPVSNAGKPRSDAPWDVSFLRVGALSTAAVTVVAAPVVGLFAGRPAALGVVVGAVVVTSFFCLSGLVIAWAGRIDDAFTLPAALGTFVVKVLVFFAVLSALPADGWIDRRAMAWAVVAGALLWSAVQARWVWSRPLYYVPPPAPPEGTGSVASRTPLPDPEKPASRG
jgi:hypothetical protein